MLSRKMMFNSFVLLVIALQTQSTLGKSSILSCEPFSKKSGLAFVVHLGTSGTLHCPPPNVIRNDELSFCCKEENTGLPICCDFLHYAQQHSVLILVGVVFGVILLVALCFCCYKRHHQPIVTFIRRI